MRPSLAFLSSFALVFLFAHPALAQSSPSASASVTAGDLQGNYPRETESSTGTTSATVGPVSTAGNGSTAKASANVVNGAITLSASTSSTNPQLSAGYATASASFSDTLHFGVGIPGPFNSVTFQPFSIPVNAIEITDNYSASVSGSANLQVITTIGGLHFTVTDNILSGLQGSTSAPGLADSISVSPTQLTYSIDSNYFGGADGFTYSTTYPVSFTVNASASLADALGYPGGSASFTDPITFTFLDADGNVIPNAIVESDAGITYNVTDGYVLPPTPGPSSTPEPASLLLLGTGILAALPTVRRRVRS